MLSLREIIDATGGTILNEASPDFSGVSIDSRTIKEGELFIALKGDRFDGHAFVMNALEKGAGAMLDRNTVCSKGRGMQNHKVCIEKYAYTGTIILVNNTVQALHDIARYVRNRFNGHVIGVVGSNGKTTTKELISSILGTRFDILKTEGNFNNHIGMPLSIIKCRKETEAMVLEMGTNKPHDIDELCTIARPDIGVITNIGYEHLEGFGSLSIVRESELEILPYVRSVIVNNDDAFLMEGVKRIFEGEIITFGIQNTSATVKAGQIIFSGGGTSFTLSAGDEHITVTSQLRGQFNVSNCLAAASTAFALGFGLKDIKTGLESFRGLPMRFEVVQYEGATFLNDVYNANPSSTEESIKELIRMSACSTYKRAIVVLGDMLELGESGVPSHKKLGQSMSEHPIDLFIGVGTLMTHAVSEFKGKGIHEATSEGAGRHLSKVVKEGDIILIKGSRGMRMEKVLAVIRDSFKKPDALRED